ncbi:MAG: RcnB family protein [Caulobacteraceae bacterium]
MKHILLSAAALILVAGAAQAQNDQNHHEQHGARQNSGKTSQPANRGNAPRGGQRYTPQNSQPRTQQGPARLGSQTYTRQPQYRAPQGNAPQKSDRRYAPTQNGNYGYRQRGVTAPSSDLSRNRGVYVNRNAFASSNWWRGRRGFQGYEGHRNGYWFAPGWGYYQVDPRWYDFDWQVGVAVPYDLRSYVIDDPYDYGLPPAPYGAAWIFLGDQIVLIDLQSGQIIQMAGAY